MVLRIVDAVSDGAISVDGAGAAIAAALVISAISTVLEVVVGSNDDDTYSLRVIQRIARRSGERVETDVPGSCTSRSTGSRCRCSSARCGTATHRRWRAGSPMAGIALEWETDLSSQTGASQAGILLGSNENIPAFRWVEKETRDDDDLLGAGRLREIERRHAGDGLLRNGGASRGNLLSGEADHVILTVSRMEAEKGANPGYRAFFSNAHNVTRALVLFFWEVILEWVAALRAIRRDVQPRGHRGGIYPFMRGAMCVIVRDLIVFGVLTDLMKGRPAIYATFSSYDEVAHHSGLERADTLEALRKLDQQFGRIDRARRYAPRPYEIVVLSDHGQTQGATFKQRNGYGLDDLVERSLAIRGRGRVRRRGRAERDGRATRVNEATGTDSRSGRRTTSPTGSRRHGLREPRARLPHGGEPSAHPGGDRGAAPAPHAGPPRAPACRLAARSLRRARRGRARREGRPVPGGRSRRG